MPLKPEDEYFHDRSTWPGWDEDCNHWFNESGLFDFSVREHDMSGFFYVHHRANRGFLWCGVGLWDPTGDTETDCLWNDFTVHPLPAGSQVWDFDLTTNVSRLTSECVEPLKTYHFTYEAAGTQMDITWSALHPPVDLPVPPDWQEWAPMHYDHMGRMTGTVTVEGRTHPVDCWSGHDRSFGPHKMARTGRGSFVWGGISEDEGFIAHVLSEHPPETDPVFGTTESVQGGWYRADGVVGRFVSGTRVCQRGPDTRPLREVINAVDEHGRQIELIGTVRNHLLFTGFPEYPWWWSLVDWQINGHTGGYGETQDSCGTMQNFRRVVRGIEQRDRTPAVTGVPVR
ncbi:MAG TPA: hypothetical protein VGH89_38235 [Pseudonocardia sp.]